MSLNEQIDALRQQIAALERSKQQQETEEELVVKQFHEAAKSHKNWEYYLPQHMDFMRMVDMNEDYHDVSFAQFIAWNLEKIKNLSADDKLWMAGLCRRIRVDKMTMMDMESCVAWDSCGFYYDARGHLCIFHPR
jgi:hypothetical protein